MPSVPRSPFAVGFMLFRGWRKMTPAQRRIVLDLARAHGPRIAAGAAAAATARARRRPR